MSFNEKYKTLENECSLNKEIDDLFNIILYVQYLRRQPIRWGNQPAEGGNQTPTAQADPINEPNAHYTEEKSVEQCGFYHMNSVIAQHIRN